MPPPTYIVRFRQSLGRAMRETGQAIDRAGIWGGKQALTKREVGDDPCIYQDHLSRHRNLMPLYRRGAPEISSGVAFVAPCSTVVGRVSVGEGSSIWYGSVLRADEAECAVGTESYDVERWKELSVEERKRIDPNERGESGGGGIYVGVNTNLQDGVIVTSREHHSIIGDGVTVGHGAQIHSATVGDYSLIGMGSVLSPNVTVEGGAFVAAGSAVMRGTIVKSGELWAGSPARKLRDLTQEEVDKLKYQAEEYVKVAGGQSGIMELGGNVPLKLSGDTSEEEEEEVEGRMP